MRRLTEATSNAEMPENTLQVQEKIGFNSELTALPLKVKEDFTGVSSERGKYDKIKRVVWDLGCDVLLLPPHSHASLPFTSSRTR